MNGDKDQLIGVDMEIGNPGSKTQSKIDPEFLRCFYANQYDQRWRGSRNQDWSILGMTVTMAVAIIVLNINQMSSNDPWILGVMLSVPVIVIFLCKNGLRILHLHQIVMSHADHIGKGIGWHLGVHEDRKPKSTDSGVESVDHPFKCFTDKDHVIYVGPKTDDSGTYFSYPEKETFKNSNGFDYNKFKGWIFTSHNVQATMGRMYYILIWISAILIIVDLFLWLRSLGVPLP